MNDPYTLFTKETLDDVNKLVRLEQNSSAESRIEKDPLLRPEFGYFNSYLTLHTANKNNIVANDMNIFWKACADHFKKMSKVKGKFFGNFHKIEFFD